MNALIRVALSSGSSRLEGNAFSRNGIRYIMNNSGRTAAEMDSMLNMAVANERAFDRMLRTGQVQAAGGGGGGGRIIVTPPGGAARKQIAGPTAITGGAGGAGYLGKAMWGAGAGAVFGGVMGEEGNRGRSAIAGAFGGMAGGAAMASYARWGAGSSTQAINKIGSMVGTGRIGKAWASKGSAVTHKGLSGYHKASNRNAVFASGAMLGGGAFGAMFASNGRSHKRGFNSSRGNSFSR